MLAAPRPQVYGIRTRSRAVEIFTTCAHMICNMEELEKVSEPLSGQMVCPGVLWDVWGTHQPCFDAVSILAGFLIRV